MIPVLLLAAAVRIVDPAGNAVPGAAATCVDPGCKRMRCEAAGYLPTEIEPSGASPSCTITPGAVVVGEIAASAASRGLTARLVPRGKDTKPAATVEVPKAAAGAAFAGFQIPAVPSGRYALELARASDGWLCRVDLGPLAAGRHRVAGAFREPASVSVRVKDAEGKPAAEIPIAVPRASEPPAAGTWTCGPVERKPASTDVAGSAKVPLDPGASTLIVAGDWKHPKGLASAVLDRAPSDPLTLTLALPVRVRAKVLDEKDRPVACDGVLSDLPADVGRLVDGLPGGSIKSACEASGVLTLGPVPAAALTVSVRPRAGLPLRVAVDRPAPGTTADLGVLRIKSGESIRVRVADDAGNPIAGASVMVRASSGIVLSAKGTTGDDGVVELGGLPKNATLALAVSAKGYAEGSLEGLQGDADPFNVTLTRGGTIPGLVEDESGQPVEGASVTLADESGQSPQSQISDAAGAFTFDGLPDGTWRLSAIATGYKMSEPATVTVGDHRKADDVRLTLTPASATSGRVVDATGAPVAGARVRLLMCWMLSDLDRQTPSAELLTSSDGGFELRAAAFPDHCLVATKAGYGPAVERAARALGSGDVVLTLSDAATLVVHLPPRSPATGIKVRDGAGVGRVIQRGGRADITVPDLAPGRGSAGVLRGSDRPVVLAAGRTAEVTLEAGGSVEGRVGFNGAPAPRAVVRANQDSPKGFGQGNTAFTDERGRYKIEGLGADTYRVVALSEDGRGEAVIDLAEGEAAHADITIRSVRFALQVIDGADDKPVSGAFVAVSPGGKVCGSSGRHASWGDVGDLGFDVSAGSNGCQTATTDATGAARFALADSGSYDVEVGDRRYEPWKLSLALGEGTTEKRASLTRKPEANTDKPRVIADLRTDPPGMQGRISCIWGDNVNSSSPVSGRAACENMAPGPGEIVFTVDGYGRGRATFTVPDSGELVVPVVVVRGGTIVVPVTEAGTQPRIVDASGLDWTSQSARASGEFSDLPNIGRAWVFSDMPPGTYTAIVNGKARAAVPLAPGGTATAY